MTDEIKTNDEQKCLCTSKGFRKFAVIALGAFVGVFCALCFFCALHKPPVMNPYFNPMMAPYGAYGPAYGHHHHCNCPCHKKMMRKWKEQKK